MIVIGTTDGETIDRRGGGACNSQGRSGKDAVTKSGERSLDLTGNLAVGIPEDRTL